MVLTSNRTRELNEALRRRCIYHWIPYPDPQREAEIIMLRAGEVAEATARAVVAAVNGLRKLPLVKAPGIAEAVDWARAAQVLDGGAGDWPKALKRSIGQVLKDEEDLQLVADKLDDLLGARPAMRERLGNRCAPFEAPASPGHLRMRGEVCAFTAMMPSSRHAAIRAETPTSSC